MERDLHRMVRTSSDLQLSTFWLTLPVRTKHGTRNVSWPVLAPHEHFAALGMAGRLEFLTGAGAAGGPSEFWRMAARESWAASHPVYQDVARLPYSVPIRIYGDEGTGLKKKSVLVLNWQSTLFHGCSLDSRHLVTVLPRKTQGPETMDVLMDFLTWSLNHLFEGTWPNGVGKPGELRHVMQGRPLFGPWRGAFAGLKGDWKFLKELLKSKRSYNSSFVCFKCFACNHQEPLAFTDVREAATWRYTVERQEHYLANTPEDQRSPLVRLRGFDVALILPDLLHVCYLGVGRDVCGSALEVMAQQEAWGPGAPNECLQLALNLHKTWLSANRLGTCSLDDLTLQKLHSGDRTFPEFPGKGIDVKLMLPWLAMEASRWASLRGDLEKLLATTVWALVAFLAVLDAGGMFLTPEEQERAYQLGSRFMEGWVTLGKQALDNKLLLYKQRPKTHLFHHLVIGCREDSANCRYWGCWDDEDYVGRLSRVTRKTHPRTLATSTVQRHLLMLALRWHKNR